MTKATLCTSFYMSEVCFDFTEHLGMWKKVWLPVALGISLRCAAMSSTSGEETWPIYSIASRSIAVSFHVTPACSKCHDFPEDTQLPLASTWHSQGGAERSRKVPRNPSSQVNTIDRLRRRTPDVGRCHFELLQLHEQGLEHLKAPEPRARRGRRPKQ